MTEPTPSETALSAEEEAKFRESVAAIDRAVGDDDYSLQWSNRVARRLLATLDAERASRSATEESLRAALDECRQHHADTLAGNERGQHRSATGGREALRQAVGTSDEDSGLEHWHFARGGRTSPDERVGVFVDRQQVLDVIDRVLG